MPIGQGCLFLQWVVVTADSELVKKLRISDCGKQKPKWDICISSHKTAQGYITEERREECKGESSVEYLLVGVTWSLNSDFSAALIISMRPGNDSIGPLNSVTMEWHGEDEAPPSLGT